MHEYVRRISAALANGVIDVGTVTQCSVAHDDRGKRRCAIYRGGECNCDPEITVVASNGVFRVGRDGLVRKS